MPLFAPLEKFQQADLPPRTKSFWQMAGPGAVLVGLSIGAGEIILAGSFTRPMWVERGDSVKCDYGPLGVIECRFV